MIFTRSSLPGDYEIFWCETFEVHINLLKNGIVEGKIVHLADIFKLSSPFRGIYIEDENKIVLSFCIEWSNPNLESRNLTCYSGRMINFNGNRLLLLKWLQVTETGLTLANVGVIDSSVLRLREAACNVKDTIRINGEGF
jgi:hypothetical protein